MLKPDSIFVDPGAAPHPGGPRGWSGAPAWLAGSTGAQASRGSIAILGGGISALACAHYSLRAGLLPVVFVPATRARAELGGDLARRFEIGGHAFDSFHAPLRRSDTALCGLVADLDRLHTLVWRSTRGALYATAQRRFVRTHAGLLAARSRAALEQLRARRREAPGTADASRPDPWCEPSGRHPWRALTADLAPAARGHLRGGHRALVDALERSLAERGCPILRDVQLQAVDVAGDRALIEWDAHARQFDGVISTLPLADLAKRGRGAWVRSLPFPEVSPHARTSVVVLTRRAPRLPYLTVPLGPDALFDRIYSAAHLVPEMERGDLHPLYLDRCEDGTRPASDDELIHAATRLLGELAPDLRPGDRLAIEVFRGAEADITGAPEILAHPPARRVGASLVFLCAAARPYRRRASADTSVMLARETVSEFVRQR